MEGKVESSNELGAVEKFLFSLERIIFQGVSKLFVSNQCYLVVRANPLELT
jgi:hypothetical protein